MDPSRCDRLARAAGTRRAALGLLAALAAGGGPVAAGRSKKKCRPACAPCWRCARGTCRPAADGARCLGGVCRGGSCVACGGQLQPCCADDRCTQGDCDMFGFCGACGGFLQPCCAGQICDSGLTCQLPGACVNF